MPLVIDCVYAQVYNHNPDPTKGCSIYLGINLKELINVML